MKFIVLISAMLISATAFADCMTPFETGYNHAISAQQACKAGKEATQKIHIFFNSAEENCMHAKKSLEAYTSCYNHSQSGVTNFKQVTDQCEDYEGAQKNIGLLNYYIADADSSIRTGQNMINNFCK